jgi:hypothetical protein
MSFADANKEAETIDKAAEISRNVLVKNSGPSVARSGIAKLLRKLDSCAGRQITSARDRCRRSLILLETNCTSSKKAAR